MDDAWNLAPGTPLIAQTHHPNQPPVNPGDPLDQTSHSGGGVTLCPPEMNDLALAEFAVITMRIAALKEIKGGGEVARPSLKTILEYQGDRVTPAVESTPHEIATVYAGAFEGIERA